METITTADLILELLGKHWKMLSLIMVSLTAGGYTIARWRNSGLRKMLNDHDAILVELSERLNRLRTQLEDARDELQKARSDQFKDQEQIALLESKVKDLEEREKELLQRLNDD